MRRARLSMLLILIMAGAVGCGKSKDPEVFIGRGDVYLQKGDFDKAIAEYNWALQLNPADPGALQGRGNAYLSKGMFAQGLADFRELVRVADDESEAHNALAWVLATCTEAKVRNGREALEQAQRAIALDENDPNYWDTLAAAYAELGQFDDAVLWQKKALAHADFPAESLERARQRLKLYEQKKPFRDVGNKGL